MNRQSTPKYLTFNVVIDDVVLPDGRTEMELLGGGGVQTAFGLRLWSDSVALAGSIGADFPRALWTQLQALGLDLGGLRQGDQPSLRAWQVFEADGRRRQLWRSGGKALAQHLACRAELLPEGFRGAGAAHIGLHPLEADLDFLRELQANGTLLSAEAFKPAERPLTEGELSRLLGALDIFSLNREEAASLFGKGNPEDHLAALSAAGVRVVALRMGSEGALLTDGQVTLRQPAPPMCVHSLLGAGNAYCGGFLSAWRETGDLREAGVRGAVAASFMLEQVGLPSFTPALRDEAARRRKAYIDSLSS